MGLEIKVNGEFHEVESRTLGAALDELGFGSRAKAAELNGVAVDATAHHETELSEGDAIEVVGLVGGG